MSCGVGWHEPIQIKTGFGKSAGLQVANDQAIAYIRCCHPEFFPFRSVFYVRFNSNVCSFKSPISQFHFKFRYGFPHSVTVFHFRLDFVDKHRNFGLALKNKIRFAFRRFFIPSEFRRNDFAVPLV